jgi:ribosomal protein S18 acetylase RimI-like enzyme
MRVHQDVDPIFEPRENSVPGFEENEVRRLMKSADGLVLVALDKGQAVGFSLSEIHEPMKGYKLDRFGIISTMAITAHYRRQGIGEKMISEIYAWFQSQNIEWVELDVLVGNQPAYNFWRKQGFTDYRHRMFRKIYRQIIYIL